jgi:hypothetical protein
VLTFLLFSPVSSSEDFCNVSHKGGVIARIDHKCAAASTKSSVKERR